MQTRSSAKPTHGCRVTGSASCWMCVTTSSSRGACTAADVRQQDLRICCVAMVSECFLVSKLARNWCMP